MSEQIADRPDGWLIKAWNSGDEQAARVLVERYSIRLVALVARQLSSRFRKTIDPAEVVQSAFGSFFVAAGKKSLHVSESLSAWRLLATFAKRKMIRAIEHHSALKRGKGVQTVTIGENDLLAQEWIKSPNESEASSLIESLSEELPSELFEVVETLLAGRTQSEIAVSLGISERTARRRLVQIRELLSDEKKPTSPTDQRSLDPPVEDWNARPLPSVDYGEFVLGKLVGSGGFGKVYRGARQSDKKTIAVKFLRKAFWQNEEAKRSFVREVNSAYQVRHPGIIRYLGWGESPHGGPYVLSDWIEGKPLRELRSASLDTFSDWLVQLFSAIEAVHSAGLVHGDLTPNNIMVDRNNRVVITDFGFARMVDDNRSLILGGTPGFAAPEQVSPAFGSISHKTDVFAIGGVVYWFLVGRPPVYGQTLEDVLSDTMSLRPILLPSVEEVPSEFRQLLLRALEPSPSERAASVSELMRILKQPTD